MNARQWTVRRKRNALRVLFAVSVALMAFPFALFASEGDNGIEKDVNGMKVELIIGAPEPKIGKNQLTVRVVDAQNQPVLNAEIALVIAMDTSAAMSMDMDKEKSKTVLLTARAAEAGAYEGTVELGFDGKWMADMELSRGGITDKAKFEFEVARSGPNWTIILVFAAAIILVLGGAVLLRSRRPRPAKGSAA
jgi:hypothetical protein